MAQDRFEEVKANAWTQEVESELNAVSTLLKEVATECATQPYEDDTIMNMLHDAGSQLEESWGELANQFIKTVSSMFSLISKYAEFVSRISDEFANVFNRFSN